MIALHDRDREADVREVHRDPSAHRAGADDADALDLDLGCVARDVRDLPDLALGEERIALRGRLVALQEFHEESAFGFETLLEGFVHGRFDAADVVLRCQEAACLARDLLAESLEDLGFSARGLDLLVELIDLAQRSVLIENLAREGDRATFELAFFDEFIQQAEFETFAGLHMTPARHHFERLLDADDPRESLRPARAGEQAEIDLG